MKIFLLLGGLQIRILKTVGLQIRPNEAKNLMQKRI